MIDRIRLGKRIAGMRRQRGISQTELAERLGVTSQAVSKWECGNAIPDIEILLALSHLFGVTINDMLEEHDLLADMTGRRRNRDGVTYFVPEEDKREYAAWAEAIRRERWIRQNWLASREQNRLMDRIGAEIAARGGLILEIGAGPGGGFMPYVLKADPDARMIISDMSPTVVREWKAWLDGALQSPVLYYAAMDFCRMPFADGSIDVVADRGGIANCIGDKAQALQEAFRVLKPGGMLVTMTGFITRETLADLPERVQNVLKEKRPDVLADLYAETVMAGFSRIDSEICGGWNTDDDESGITDLARSLGVDLHFTGYVRRCMKE